MKCSRCKGVMFQERFFGPGDPFWGWRCFRCGEIMDAQIFENRIQQMTSRRKKGGEAGSADE